MIIKGLLGELECVFVLQKCLGLAFFKIKHHKTSEAN